MFSFTEKDLDAIAMLSPVTANNNKVDVNAIIVEAHYARSEFLHGAIGSAVAKVTKAFVSYNAKQKAMKQLYAMSNGELADLGVARSNIRHAVLGDTAVKDVFGVRLSKAVVSIVRKYGEWRNRRAGYAQLMAMDARQLSDIGLTRGNISVAITGHIALSNDNLFAANSNNGRKVS